MTTKVDYACKYPKTSCMCGMCPSCCTQDYFTNWEDCRKVNPSSLGISNCYLDERFNCVDKMWYNNSKEPKPNTCDVKILNPHFGITPVPAFLPVNQSGFYPVKCNPDKDCECKVPCKGGCDFKRNDCDKGCKYVSMDPRLLDARRGERLFLDRPPYEGEVLLNEVYSDKLKNYGQCYENYSDIHSGQIMYYISEDLAPAYHYPNFPTEANVQHELIKDPMGVINPQYPRNPLTEYTHYQTNPNTTQWSYDSQFQRLDLMALQMRKRTEQRYETRWNCMN